MGSGMRGSGVTVLRRPSSASALLRASLLMWLGIPFLIVLLQALNVENTLVGLLYVFLVPCLSCLWIALGVLSTLWCVQFVREGAWRSAAVALIVPASVLLVLRDSLFPYPLLRAGDIIHFVVAKPFYDHAIADLPKDRRLKVFDWGGALLIVDKVVIYDESDQVGLLMFQRSASWRARATDARLGGLCGAADPLWDHYYLEENAC
jgi:hypothetical protein